MNFFAGGLDIDRSSRAFEGGDYYSDNEECKEYSETLSGGRQDPVLIWRNNRKNEYPLLIFFGDSGRCFCEGMFANGIVDGLLFADSKKKPDDLDPTWEIMGGKLENIEHKLCGLKLKDRHNLLAVALQAEMGGQKNFVSVVVFLGSPPVENCSRIVEQVANSFKAKKILLFDSLDRHKYISSSHMEAKQGNLFLRRLSVFPQKTEICSLLEAPNFLFGLSASFLEYFAINGIDCDCYISLEDQPLEVHSVKSFESIVFNLWPLTSGKKIDYIQYLKHLNHNPTMYSLYI